ncbi:MAG: hypothetical protein ACT6T0_00365 [Nevskia sp.]
MISLLAGAFSTTDFEYPFFWATIALLNCTSKTKRKNRGAARKAQREKKGNRKENNSRGKRLLGNSAERLFRTCFAN